MDLLTPELEYERDSDAASGRLWRRRPFARVDLHCHSTFSDERIRYLPGLNFRPLLEPEEVYDLAKARGMDFVTLTDHDTIDGCKALLDRRGPLADFFFGEEVTVRFPEDGTIVHINVFDIDEDQHHELQRLRGDIHDVLDYTRRIDKLVVLNHMTWTQQHRPLKSHHIDIMLEKFDVFEGLNGARSYAHNAFAWHATRGRGKTLVGGSDSHTLRVGTTYTLGRGDSCSDLIAGIRAGNAGPAGACGTPERLREDVWILVQKNVERRLEQASSAWYRGVCHSFEQLSRVATPLVCFGYHARQNLLIRESLRALPA